jgi:hypothetical protein
MSRYIVGFVFMLAGIFVVSVAQATQNLAQQFSALKQSSPKYYYYYVGSNDLVTWNVAVPDNIVEMIVQAYSVPKKFRDKLYIESAMANEDIYLIRFGIKWLEEGSESNEAKLHRQIIRKYCEQIKQNFEGTCQNRNPLKERIYTIVNVNTKQVVPIPKYFTMRGGIPSILSDSSLDQLRIKYTVSRHYSLMPFGDVFTNATFGLNIGESRRCLAGKFALADFNGDGKKEFFIISGDINDDALEFQVEPKVMGITRVNLAILDINSGVARPLLSEELFSYEMDYRPYYRSGLGDGIYRDTKLYWGDFNKDGYSDYLIRRRQADLHFTFKTGRDRFRAEPFKESVQLFLGNTTGGYNVFKPEDEKEFLEFVLGATNWEDGFPPQHDCMKIE